MSSGRTAYIREIDGLRAVAVLAVMLSHINTKYLPGGFTGVDVFFVISGYVVCKSLAGTPFQQFPGYLVGFYKRRIIRIFPALIVCIVFASLITVMLTPDMWFNQTARNTSLWALFGASNIALITINENCFAPCIAHNPFVHTWSLGVEEQYYFVFPFLFFIWMVWHNSAGAKWLLAWSLIPVIALLSLFFAWWAGTYHPDWAFYLLPSRFWELAVGAVLFKLHTEARMLSQSPTDAALRVYFGLALVLSGLWMADPTGVPFPWALPAVLGTALVISGLAQPVYNTSSVHRLLRNSAINYVGLISYSLYLWHWPVFVLFRWTLGFESPIHILSAVLVSFVLSAASYHFVEQPFRRSSFLKSSRPLLVLIPGIAIIAAALMVTHTLYDIRREIGLSVTNDAAIWSPLPTDRWGEIDHTSVLAGKQIFVLGDSHATAYSTLLKEASDKLGVRVHLWVSERCAIGNLRYPIGVKPECHDTVADVLADLQLKANPGDVVFLASRRTYRIGSPWKSWDIDETFSRTREDRQINNRRTALQEAIDFIEKVQGLKKLGILINAPKPVFPSPPFRCSDRFNHNNPRCGQNLDVSRDFLLALRTPVNEALDELNVTFENLLVWDAFPELCTDDFCLPYDNTGKPLFFDGNHLSGHGNRVLYAGFEKLILRAFPEISEAN